MKKYLYLILGLLLSGSVLGQVGIGETQFLPEQSAMLEVRSGNISSPRGLLIPKFNTARETNIINNNPAEGLMYYSIDKKKFIFYDGTSFLRLNAWTPSADFSSVYFPGKVAIGTNTPSSYQLEVDNGDAHFSQNVAVDGNTTIEGDLTVNPTGTLNGYGTVPQGGILMWSGTNVPDGWAICNGQTANGYTTPDLSGRFVVGYSGSGDYSNPGDLSEKGSISGGTGGEEFHTLTVGEMPTHNHFIDIRTANDGVHSHTIEGFDNQGSGSWEAEVDRDDNRKDQHNFSTNRDGAHSHAVRGNSNSTGGSQAHENRPPYYVLAFIMRVK